MDEDKLLAWADKQMNKWFDEISRWTNADNIECATLNFMDKLKEIIKVLKGR